MDTMPAYAEVRQIESQLQMPFGTRPLAAYVRYYYSPDSGHIHGIYVSRSLLELDLGPGKVPAEPIVLVANDEAVPRGWDAECEVVHVDYSARDARITTTYCDPGVFSGYPAADGIGSFGIVLFASLLGVLLGCITILLRAARSYWRRGAP